MSVQPLTTVMNAGSGSQATTKVGNGLGKDDFLQLLVAQLKNQDPMSPVGDKEFIAQLAQFNSLEQMQSLNNKFMEMIQWQQLSQSSSLIGKKIDAINSESAITGLVTEVRISSAGPILKVDGKDVALGDITRIYS
jgi:flagellar basal-body rod modification protein FlgD